MAWYRTGAVSLTTGSNVVTGTGTDWKKNINGIGQGQALVANKTRVEIMYVDSDTQIRLAEPWSEPAYSGAYHIETAFAGTTGDSARQVMAALFLWKQMGVDWDEWLTSEAATVEVTNVFGEKVTIPTWKALSGASALMDAVESITETLVTWKGNYSHRFKGGLSVGSSEYSGIELVQHTGRYTRIENTPHGAANFLTIVKRNADGSTVSSYSIPSGIGTAATQQWVNNDTVLSNFRAKQGLDLFGRGAVYAQQFMGARESTLSDTGSLIQFEARVGSNSPVISVAKMAPGSSANWKYYSFDETWGGTLAVKDWVNASFYGLFGETAPSNINVNMTPGYYNNRSGAGSVAKGFPMDEFGSLCVEPSDLLQSTVASGYQIQRYITGHNGFVFTRKMSANTPGAWRVMVSSTDISLRNVIADTNGFIKKSSPIVFIKHGGYATNAESRGAKVAKLSTGEYLVSGILGYHDDGAWGVAGGISVPKDNNGLELVYVKDEVQPDGSIIVRTYHRQHSHLPEMFQNTRKKSDGTTYEDGEPCDLPTYTRLDMRVQMPENCEYARRMTVEDRSRMARLVYQAIQKVLSDKTLCLPAPTGI